MINNDLSNIYSTNEIKIGNFNKKTLYRKLLMVDIGTNIGTWNDIIDLSSLNIETLVSFRGTLTGDVIVTLPANEGNYYINIRYNTSTKTLQYRRSENSWTSQTQGTITLEYTKTTD